jgi:hypothetical protein
MAMTYRARLPAALEAADLTHGERELARWAALPFERKLRVVFYLLRRFWRLFRDEAWRAAHVAAWETSVYARAICTALSQARRAFRREGCQGPAHRGDWAGSFRGRDQESGPELALIAAALALVLLAGSFHSEKRTARPSIVEQARAVRDYYPPRCYYEADGDVVVMDSTWRVIRPNDRRRERLLRQFCT